MADTDTAGILGCEVRAGTSDAEGCGMDASVDRLAGVAPETTARTDDEVLGTVGSQGVAQAPLAGTDTAGTAEQSQWRTQTR